MSGRGRYVRLGLPDNCGDAFTRTGPAEVRVSGTIPEPATWAMMILGFGLVGAVGRRRESRAAAWPAWA